MELRGADGRSYLAIDLLGHTRLDWRFAVAVRAEGFAGDAFLKFDPADVRRFVAQLEADPSAVLEGVSEDGINACRIAISGDNLRVRLARSGFHRVETGFALPPDSRPLVLAQFRELIDSARLTTGEPWSPPPPPEPPVPDWPGLPWRFLARDWHDPDREIFHLMSDRTTWFDELAVGDWFHIEWMHGRHWWMRVGDARINVAVPKGAPPVLDIERGVYGPEPTPELMEASYAAMDNSDGPYGPEEDEEDE